jgi:hypothetical protein
MFSGKENDNDKIPVLYEKNELFVPDTPIQDLCQRRASFQLQVRLKFLSKGRPRHKTNLLPNQESALQWLLNNNQITVLNADKNLGPVVMDRTQYLRFAYIDHLRDTDTYTRLSPEEATRRMTVTAERIFNFLDLFPELSPTDYFYIERNTTRNIGKPSFMYLLAKIHKTPLKTRAIISYSGSLCHGIAKWLDVYLKKIISHMPYVATSSKRTVEQITERKWHHTSTLFTMDAVSMYTNIHLGHALPSILSFLTDTPLGRNIVATEDIHLAQLEYALDLVMKNNIFQFGDTYWQQIAGTAMGTPPAPDYATLYFAIFEYRIIPLFPELSYYVRYIDDGFGIWTPTPSSSTTLQTSRYKLFQDTIQTYGLDHEFFTDDTNSLRPLQWTFEERGKSAIFLDLRISLHHDTIETTIYEKKLNLYLYLPPHSCHPPGVLKGLIFGFAFRAKTLCTNPSDRIPFLRKCYHRLIQRGHSPSSIAPLFKEAITRVIYSLPRCTDDRETAKELVPLFLHLKYNPFDPSSRDLQDIFKDTILSPQDGPLLSEINPRNNHGADSVDFNRMTVCYSAQRNLGSLLAPRKHRFGQDYLVSNFYRETFQDFTNGL